MYRRGLIVLIPFPFTDLSASKVRPALIISSNKQECEDVIVVFISSLKAKRLQPTDMVVKTTDKGFANTGLKGSSIIKINKIATLDKKIILGELGYISKDQEKRVNLKLKIVFNL